MSEKKREHAAHPVLQHRDGSRCVLVEDGTWFVPYDAGGEGVRCENPEHASEIPHGFRTVEYGVERGPHPTVNDGEPYVEWGASVGMSHCYPYSRESVRGLASGRRIFRRTRTSFLDSVGQPELVDPEELP